jgi:PhoH-like ATPase
MEESMEQYNGYQELILANDQFTEIYTDGCLSGYDFKENEYLIAKNDEGQVVDKFQQKQGVLERVPYQTLSNVYLGKIKPRNDQQELTIDLLLDPDTKIKIIKGVYGSGKDYLMLSAALQLIEKGKFEKIVFVRPNVSVRGLPDIGALPGTADEKLSWTLAPLWDKVGGEEGVAMMLQHKILESVPLLFIRGRSFENSIIYVTEGQNMTTEIAKLVIGRIGEGSELWINADTHQTDKKMFDEDNGVNKMIDKLGGNPLFGYVYMPKTERSSVAELATLLDD